MNTAIRLIEHEIPLEKQLESCTVIAGAKKARDFLLSYCAHAGIASLYEVSVEDFVDCRRYAGFLQDLGGRQKKYYGGLLEQAVLSFFENIENEILKDASCITERPVRNKACAFLIASGINGVDGITYPVRERYENYLATHMPQRKVMEYVKALDKMKLEAAGKAKNSFSRPVPVYKDEPFFLPYHPDYEVAAQFSHTQDKRELLFDFSLEADGKMKRQVFSMLLYSLKNKNAHDRRERFLVPLRLFYFFCIREGIRDVSRITARQEAAYREYLAENFPGRDDIYIQIVDNFKRHLFLSAKNTDWGANTWYLERFSFKDGRANPAREIRRFSFGQIENEELNSLFKLYMKYHVGIGRAALQTVRGRYYRVLHYLEYLDKNKLPVDAGREEVEPYFISLQESGNSPETVNAAIAAIANFYGYMVRTGMADAAPVHFGYYWQKSREKHLDRSIPDGGIDEILDVLKGFPLELRLMYLNLACTGLRVSEVCALKGGAYSFDGQDAWLHVRTNKLKNEKNIPVPSLLYQAMERYIAKKGIAPDEYIFKNRRGGAYDAGTFYKQFKQCLKKAGITKPFRPHDYRHSVATKLYMEGASVEAIRDYLGHRTSDMTRSYLDFMQERIDEANRNYFERKDKNG